MTEKLTGWQPDPFGAHELRYFTANGQPTRLVRDGQAWSHDEPPRSFPSSEPAPLPPVASITSVPQLLPEPHPTLTERPAAPAKRWVIEQGIDRGNESYDERPSVDAKPHHGSPQVVTESHLARPDVPVQTPVLGFQPATTNSLTATDLCAGCGTAGISGHAICAECGQRTDVSAPRPQDENSVSNARTYMHPSETEPYGGPSGHQNHPVEVGGERPPPPAPRIQEDYGSLGSRLSDGEMMPAPSSRNSAGRGSVGVYMVGVVCFVVGVYLSTITRINLLTGHTSSPYVGIGIPLAAIGFIVVVVTKRVAKQKLRK
jgi:hypothetical protein